MKNQLRILLPIAIVVIFIPYTHAATIKIKDSEMYFEILKVAFSGLIISGILNVILERHIKPDSNVLLKGLHSLSNLVFSLCFPTCAIFIGIMIIGFIMALFR